MRTLRSVPAMAGAICRVLPGIGLAFMLSTQPALASWFSSAPRPATMQAEGNPHQGPRAYHQMCAREPKLCMYDRQAGIDAVISPPAQLTDARWRQLRQINEDLNWQIRPVEDRHNQGVSDFWTIGVSRGDCEDYIIAKKHALIQAGWAPDQLLYAVVESRRTRGYHAVLVVRTNKGDYVLDNLTDRIVPWEDAGYRFVIRQSAAAPQKWVQVTGALRTAQGNVGIIAQ
ncbi:MAG: transglutaminase-like cysteine peptidase [Pseudomonadota bacterium]